MQAIKNVYRDHLERELTIPSPAFIKIAEQYFMADSLEQQLIPGTWETIRLALKLPFLIASIRNQSFSDCSLEALSSPPRSDRRFEN